MSLSFRKLILTFKWTVHFFKKLGFFVYFFACLFVCLFVLSRKLVQQALIWYTVLSIGSWTLATLLARETPPKVSGNIKNLKTMPCLVMYSRLTQVRGTHRVWTSKFDLADWDLRFQTRGRERYRDVIYTYASFFWGVIKILFSPVHSLLIEFEVAIQTGNLWRPR